MPTNRKLCTTPDSASVYSGRVFTQAQILTAKFEANDFERRWNQGKLDNHFLFEMHYLRTRG